MRVCGNLPRPGARRSLTFADFGSWADEMEDMPLPCMYITCKSGYQRRSKDDN
jgi:hypothetical protein